MLKIPMGFESTRGSRPQDFSTSSILAYSTNSIRNTSPSGSWIPPSSRSRVCEETPAEKTKRRKEQIKDEIRQINQKIKETNPETVQERRRQLFEQKFELEQELEKLDCS